MSKPRINFKRNNAPLCQQQCYEVDDKVIVINAIPGSESVGLIGQIVTVKRVGGSTNIILVNSADGREYHVWDYHIMRAKGRPSANEATPYTRLTSIYHSKKAEFKPSDIVLLRTRALTMNALATTDTYFSAHKEWIERFHYQGWITANDGQSRYYVTEVLPYDRSDYITKELYGSEPEETEEMKAALAEAVKAEADHSSKMSKGFAELDGPAIKPKLQHMDYSHLETRMSAVCHDYSQGLRGNEITGIVFDDLYDASKMGQAVHKAFAGSPFTINNISRPKDNTMSTIKVETVTLVNGERVAELSLDRIVDYIARSENEIKKFNELKNKPDAIKRRIVAIQEGIDALVAALDARDAESIPPK